VLSQCQLAGFEPIPAPPFASLADTLAAIGAGTPTWTVVYASQTSMFALYRRVAFRRFRTPTMSVPTGLAVRSNDAPSWLTGLIAASEAAVVHRPGITTADRCDC
jgi:hypothetical protein